MSAGMQWVAVDDLQQRFRSPLLIEVDGDRTDLAGALVEVVDVQQLASGELFTILHVPGGTLPCSAERAMSITY